jgi:hypothetical protein
MGKMGKPHGSLRGQIPYGVLRSKLIKNDKVSIKV